MTAPESWALSYLVNALWQIPLLLAAGLLAARLLRPVGPEAEHRVWVSVLLLQVLLPACSAAQFAWLRALLVWDRAGSPVDARVTVLMGSGSASGAFQLSAALPAILLLAWLATLLWFAARFLWRWLQLRSIRQESVALTLDPASARIWTDCSNRFGVRRASLAASSRISAPVTMGITHKLLLLPEALAPRISGTELETVLAHEFAHMRRNDFLKHLACEIVSLPGAWHPALWLTRARITETREMVCDGMAAGLSGRSRYARSLLRLAALVIESPPTAPVQAVGIFDSRTLERRLMKLAEQPLAIRGLRRFGAVTASLTLAAVTCASALALHMQVHGADASGHHPTAHPSLIHVKSGVMAGNRISGPIPKYPEAAKKAHIQGTVVIEATINKDGDVRDLKVISGPKELRQSSTDAVSQWKYKPYLLNGEPVDVTTSINVIYALGNKGSRPGLPAEKNSEEKKSVPPPPPPPPPQPQ